MKNKRYNMFTKIKNFEDYGISECGKVYSYKSSKRLTPTKNSSGYYQVFFTVENVRYSFLLHRILAFVFKDLPDLYSDLEVDHIDTDHTNNSLDNLQVLSRKKHQHKTLKSRGLDFKSNYCGCGKLLQKNHYVECIDCRKNKSEQLDLKVEDVIFWVTNYSWVRASKELGMSDNGLRKFYKKVTGNCPKLLKNSETINI
jgi:hypothetical protein